MKNTGTAPSLTLLFLVLFTSGGVLYTLGAAVGSALFISSLPLGDVPHIVPWVYVGAAVASVATAVTYDRLLVRMSRMAALLITQLSLAAFFSGSMWLWVKEKPSHYYVLTVGLDAASILSLTLFFGFAADYFSPRDARRLYGWIAGGLAVGTVVGGEGLSRLLALISVPDLVHVCALVMVLNAGLCLIIGRVGVPVVSPTADTESKQEVSLSVLWSSRYVRLVWLTFVLGMLLTVASAFQMQWIASEKPRAELAGFFGRFYAWVGAGELVFQFLFVPWLLRTLGVLGALMLPPFMVGAASGIMQSASAVNYLGGTQLGYSAAVNGVRLTLEETLSMPARELLFLPLPARMRSRAQTLAGALLAPLTRGLAGLLLLLYVGAGFGIDQLSYVVMVCALWLLLIFVALRKPYREVLFDSLRKGGLGNTDLASLVDAKGADVVLRELLKSEDPLVVAFSLDLLGTRDMPTLIPVVKPLALHGSSDISARALAFVGAQADPSVRPVIELSLESPRPPVVAAALLALARLDGSQARARILPFLQADAHSVSEAALLALAMHVHADADVMPRVTKLLQSESVSERARGIALIERICLPQYGDLLTGLVESPDVNERRAAAAAAAACGSSQAAGALVARLRQGELSPSALLKLGPSALGALSQALATPMPPAERRQLLRGLAELPHADSLSLLVHEVQSSQDVLTRATAAECLRKVALNEALPSATRVHVDELIEHECDAADRLLEVLRTLGKADADVAELLFEHVQLRLELVTCLAGTYVARDAYVRMRGSLDSSSALLRSSALELLDASLPRRLANRVCPSLSTCQAYVPATEVGRELSSSQLDALVALGPWTSAVAARYVQARGADSAPYLHDPESSAMFDRLSEVVFLNRVPLFAALPTDYLFEIALLSDTVRLEPDQQLFGRGERGDALYMVCEGDISIEIGGRKVAQLSKGEPLGELALLDGDPRSASAVARSPARLLKLSVQRFEALLLSEPALRRALMRTLYVRVHGKRASMAGLPRDLKPASMAPGRSAQGLLEIVSVLGILRDVELFHTLPQAGLLKIATCAHTVEHFAGETLYEAGQPGDSFYVVCAGEVTLTAAGGEIERVTRGGCFGEGALMAREPRAHTARVVHDAQLARFNAAELNQLLDAEPEVSVAMLRHFAARLRAENAQRVAQ